MNDRFWAKVLFKEFIRHYRKLDDAQIVADVRKSMDDLEDLVDDADSFGSKMVRWSMERVDQYPQARENGKKGGRPKKIPQDAPNGNAGVDMSDAGNGAASKSPTSCDTFTADGDTREDSQDENSGASANHYTADAPAREDGENVYCGSDAVNLESATSANHYGDAPHREAGDESTTVSRNMRRVPQNEAPAHGFSGGRTAQGTMSRSPEAAAQSGKAYDQETAQISTNGPRQSEARQGRALESRRTGADSLRSDCHSAPVRLPDFDEFTRFIDAQGLDYTDAREWWEMTMEDRDGKDRDGKPIRNWKITCRRFCEAKAKKRKTAK